MQWAKKLLVSISAIILFMALALPTVVKSYHALFEHQEFTCIAKGDLHFHETELDCDFQKFNFSPQLFELGTVVPANSQFVLKEHIFGYYVSLTSFQELHFSLRGPPHIS